ncbi:unnamed protein product [Ectocarpus sp. 6 AP-2014]
MRNFGGLPLVLCTLVFCRLMTDDADALVGVSCGSNARAPPALRMDAKGFGRPSPTSEGKTKATRSSKVAGFGGKPVSKTPRVSGGGGNKKLTAPAKAARVGAGTKAATTGATVQEEVMRQTEESIRRSMDKLKTAQPFVWEALELKKRLALWQAQTVGLNILQLSELPPRQVQEMKDAEAQVRRLQEEHGITDRLLHNIAQEATWDASARRDERQANVQLPPSAVEHMQAVVQRSEAAGDSRVMDVGAGTGILLRFLQGAGVKQEKYVGVDLSSVMIDVASKRYPHATFLKNSKTRTPNQADFLDYCGDHLLSGGEGFSHVFFNGCLHNFLEPGEALSDAAKLLKEGGKIVISHPKGAANVDMQRRSNPLLVPNRLPTAADLQKACGAIPSLKAAGIQVQDGGQRRSGLGYLQVLQKP